MVSAGDELDWYKALNVWRLSLFHPYMRNLFGYGVDDHLDGRTAQIILTLHSAV
jgi:hypothetical protein